MASVGVRRRSWGGVSLSPGPQFPEDWAELAAGRGEYVLVPGWVRVVAAPFDEAGVLKFAQSCGQARAGCAGVGLDVVEPSHPEAQLAYGEQGPPVADELQRIGDRADSPPARFKL